MDVAALSHEFECGELTFRPIETVFPALTCPVQASFRTASRPAEHGMIANGLYHRDLRRVMFWEQSAGLVEGERIWSNFRSRGGKVAMLFWQQSMGEDADIVLTPAPIHKHHGGMIGDCYSQPAGLYEKLRGKLGPFKLRHYWGPMAKAKVGDWIVDATVEVLADAELAPDLCLTYLPTLDYDLQRHRQQGRKAKAAFKTLERQLRRLFEVARELDYEVVVFGDYAIRPAGGATYPNRALAQAGLLATREVKGMLYPDLPGSRAFAMVDHQIAHVYVGDEADIPAVGGVLRELAGVDIVLTKQEQSAYGIAHANSGELVLAAAPGVWLAYPWWTAAREAPDYASHVDIHNKPGYDPCELLKGWPPWSVSGDAGRIHGTHGGVGPANRVAWAATIDFPAVGSVLDLASAVRTWLDE